MTRLATACLAIALTGCAHQASIQTTKQWEGHYKDIETFKMQTESIQLEKGESVWVLSDRTLSRVLKNVEKK